MPASDVPAPVVLVVDDDATIRRLLQITLETEGFTVTTAGDGVEGLRMAQEAPGPTWCCSTS